MCVVDSGMVLWDRAMFVAECVRHFESLEKRRFTKMIIYRCSVGEINDTNSKTTCNDYEQVKKSKDFSLCVCQLSFVQFWLF